MKTGFIMDRIRFHNEFDSVKRGRISRRSYDVFDLIYE